MDSALWKTYYDAISENRFADKFLIVAYNYTPLLYYHVLLALLQE